MWYGNPTVANQWRPADVWDANFLMVQHLQENPDDADPAFKDSTLNNNHGTDHGGMTSADQVAGQIDGSIDFDGVDDYVETPDQGTPPQLTLEAWINTRSTIEWQCIIERGSPTAMGWHFFVNYGHRVYTNLGGKKLYTPINSITTNTWHHAVATWDGSTVRIYIDGTERASALLGSLFTAGDRVYFGIRKGTDLPFNGIIDEVRISNTARSGDWIKTSFNNQNDPATFYTVGTQESTGSVAPIPDLPAIILFGAGLLVIALYAVRMRRSRR
ncbi:LamG domain-containing protein [candidate division NPL-UPA2 bacterium]|nr:LamG domain-containing protein [candidate division NPL-UPA2 bacterium]